MDGNALCSLARLEGRLAPRLHRIGKHREKVGSPQRKLDGHPIVTCVPKIDRNVIPVLHAHPSHPGCLGPGK